jgi:hypothetical protein
MRRGLMKRWRTLNGQGDEDELESVKLGKNGDEGGSNGRYDLDADWVGLNVP